MIIYTLGPAGTFSHEAAEKIFPKERIEFAPNFDALFASLAAHPTNVGIVPIENSLHGSIDEILDLLYESNVRIFRMHDIAITHSFGARDPKTVTRIATHSQALRQCRTWLREHYPECEHLPVSSTATAAACAAGDQTVGAIASRKILEAKDLNIIADDIEGNGNTTRFAVVSVTDPFPNAVRSHMTIVLNPTGDKPGLLHALLTPFKVWDVNLTRIESRPSGQRFGHYVFFLDFLGRTDDDRTAQVLAELSTLAEVTLLGQW